MQLYVNIMPNVNLPLVRRLSCRALIGRQTATSYPAFLWLLVCSFGCLFSCCLVGLVCYIIIYSKMLFVHKPLIYFPLKTEGNRKLLIPDHVQYIHIHYSHILKERQSCSFRCIV
jgi:hypothetical protein